ncbi:MAG: FAD:protein FMN transferase [Pseudoruegeria sp.]
MTLSRRRFLTISSAACFCTGMAQAAPYQWRGVALGARAQIILDHPDAAAISARAQAEIARLEGVFSLYRADSELMRLNRAGELFAPSFDLLACLAQVGRVHKVTEGRFDPTIQPLWEVMAQAAAQGRKVDPEDWADAKGKIGFDRVHFDSESVRLDKGQALTLNGIAQGYIADRVAERMRSEGVKDVMIDAGEISAMGQYQAEAGWPITVFGEDHPRIIKDRGLATSALMGTILDNDGHQGHILDPRDGNLRPLGPRQVSVSARKAALADGLSTGLSLVSSAKDARRLLSKVKDAQLESFIT